MQMQEPPPFGHVSDTELAVPLCCGLSELPPPDVSDPVLEAYKKDVDRSLLIKNLSLTSSERAEKLVDFTRFLAEIGRAGRRLRGENP